MKELSIVGLSRRQTIWIEVAFLLIAVVAAYGGTVQFQFIHDDHLLIEQNQLLQHLSNVTSYFTVNSWQNTGDSSLYYRPILVTNWFFVYQLFGTAPWGWHLENVMLHAINVLLLFALARKILNHGPAAWLTALLFALHPVHVEAVSWVSAGCDMLMTGFALASLNCHLKSKDNPTTSIRWKIASYFFFLLSMGTKEPGITVLGMVGIYEWFTTLPPAESAAIPYKLRKIIPEMVPWVLFAVAYLFMRHIAVGMFRAEGSFNHVIVMTWPWLLWFYIKKLFWPVESSMFYDAEYVGTFSISLFWIPVLGILCFAILGGYFYRSSQDRRIPILLAWMWLPILPQWNLRIFPEHDFVHDRYLYLPSVAFCLLMGMAWNGLANILDRRKLNAQKFAAATALLLILVFVPLTYMECSNWADDILLFSHGAKTAPKYNFVPLMGLAGVLMKYDRLEEALQVSTMVEKIKPDWWVAKFNSGITLYDLKRYPEADQKFYESLDLPNVKMQQPLQYMGLTRMKMGRPEDAELALRRSLVFAQASADPELVKYQLELALCLEQLGQKDPAKAEEALKVMLEIQAKDPTAKELKKKIEVLQQLVEQFHAKKVLRP